MSPIKKHCFEKIQEIKRASREFRLALFVIKNYLSENCAKAQFSSSSDPFGQLKFKIVPLASTASRHYLTAGQNIIHSVKRYAGCGIRNGGKGPPLLYAL